MKIERFVNSIFNSNSYLLTNDSSTKVWVIDPGDSMQLITAINGRILNGILLTHSHFDHIYGINDLIKIYPDIKIYTSEWGVVGLRCDKLNGSRYMEFPFIVEHSNIEIIKDKSQIALWEDIVIEVLNTEGHNRDCVSFYTSGAMFTGDAFIPGLKVVTKSKYASKEVAAKSVGKILAYCELSDIIYPGHNESCAVKRIV